MRTRLLIIFAIVTVIVILAFTVKTKPYDGLPSDHVEELKQIPEVNMFYEKYGDYGVSVFPDGAYFYQIGFQSGLSEDQWIMLKITYQFGIPSNIFVHCTPDGIQSQYTVRDNILEYISEENCFNNESWTLGEDYCSGWCDQNELYAMGCDESILAHITNHSNLLDEEFDGKYWLEFIGLPDGMSKEKFEWCVDFIYEKRISIDLEKNTESRDNSIDGLGIEDAKGNVIHYFMNNLDEMPCRDFLNVWQEVFRTVDEHEILVDKYDTCFDETFGGLGNRHPAFLGFNIPETCTEDMIKYLVKYSSMFDRSASYAIAEIGLGDDINADDFDQCVEELLEKNPKYSENEN